QVRVPEFAAIGEFQFHRRRSSVQMPALTKRVHRHAALKVSVPRLVMLVKFQQTDRRCQVTARRGRHRKPALRLQTNSRPVYAKQNLRLTRRCLSTVEL